MPIGTVDFWVPARRTGAILTEQNARLSFTAANLIGLAPGEVHSRLEIEYDLGPGDVALRVRPRSRAFLTIPDELPPNDPLLEDVPLSEPLRSLVKGDGGHPGLRLDKYLVPVGTQEAQKAQLAKVVGQPCAEPARFDDERQRRQWMLDALDASRWTRTTAGPLTLHLARASALENAGICLHPIQGFAYLPGTGLKGLARAFAETIWLPAQPDEQKAKQVILRVFGHVAVKGKSPDHEDGAASGAVVFHDAWPEQWPRLIVDIVNNHHRGYYQGDDAPGDWETPNMVYFLAVPAGQTFSFALSARRDDAAPELLHHAREWLDGGLTHLGCGAKTAAGYGRFAVEGERPPLPQSPRVAEFETTLTLVSPAFLAGADQTSEQDCDLRPATLRGLLRWWWRTLHAGYVAADGLRALEAALWGNTRSGSLLQLSVVPDVPGHPRHFDYRDKSDPRKRYDPNPAFRRAHALADRPGNKTTQGLFYAAYGMDDQGKAGQRFHLEPGTSWRVRIVARQGGFPSPTLVADQARAALSLLCRFGAVGSKARKGFGSLEMTPGGPDLARCEAIAADFRRAALNDSLQFRTDHATSPSLGNRLGPLEIPTRWSDAWYALDQIGYAYQAFTQRYKHDPAKRALGLPRKVHGPRNEPFGGQRNPQRPPPLRGPRGDRHASPVHIHLGRADDTQLVVRVIAFPAADLPDLAESTRFLQAFLDDFGRDLNERALIDPAPPRTPSASSAWRTAIPAAPKPRDRVSVKLLSEKTKKGGWIARHEDSGLSGPVQDPKNLLQDKQPDDVVTLTVASVDQPGKKIQFKAE